MTGPQVRLRCACELVREPTAPAWQGVTLLLLHSHSLLLCLRCVCLSSPLPSARPSLAPPHTPSHTCSSRTHLLLVSVVGCTGACRRCCAAALLCRRVVVVFSRQSCSCR